nr:hypothetical protein [Tanacetum cinerariifolium]
MMHPGRLRGQQRKKLRCVKVGFSFLKTASMVTRGSKVAFGVRFCRTWRAKHNSMVVERPESGAGDAYYVQRAMIHYEIDTGDSKRHKSIGSSSFNTESGEASINLNTNVDDNDEDEVQEIQRPEGRDKARVVARKNKWSKSPASSSVNEDALARLMVTEMGAQEKEERLCCV